MPVMHLCSTHDLCDAHTNELLLEPMMRRWCASLLLPVFAAAAFAGEPTRWGQSGDWTILVDPEVGNGCFMIRTYEDGTLILIGTVPDRLGGFLAAHNPNWTDIEEGVEGVLSIDFGEALFEGAVVGKFYNDIPGGYAFFDNPNFVHEFRKRNSVILIGKKSGHQVNIDLKGSNSGINAVLACQEQQP